MLLGGNQEGKVRKRAVLGYKEGRRRVCESESLRGETRGRWVGSAKQDSVLTDR